MLRSILLLCLLASPASAQIIPLQMLPAPRPKPALPKLDPEPDQNAPIQATDRMFAHSLLTGPSEYMMPDETLCRLAQQFPALRKATAAVAIDLEILDRSEVHYFFAKPEEFGSDLRIVNQRHHELKDTPKIADIHRFPPREGLGDLIAFNRAYDKYLDNYIIWNQDRADLANFVKKENQALYQVYDLVRDARSEFYHVPVRRQAMKKLKALLESDFIKDMPGGEQFSYETMILPPCVPTWRFREER